MRLNNMFHNRFIKKWPDFMGGEPYYVIDDMGIHTLKEKGQIKTEQYEWKTDVDDPYFLRKNLEHALLVARLFVGLTIATRSHPTAKLEHFERESRNLKLSWHTSHGDVPTFANPDAFFILSDERTQNGSTERIKYPYFAEAHRGTMDLNRMIAKYRRYSLLEEDKAYQKAFPGLDFFRVLSIVDTGRHNEAASSESDKRTSTEVKKLHALIADETASEKEKARKRKIDHKKLKVPSSYRIPKDHQNMFYFTAESVYRNDYPRLLQRAYSRGDKELSKPHGIIPNPLAGGGL